MNAPTNATLAPPTNPGQPVARLPGIPIDDPRHVLSLLQHLADRADRGEAMDDLLAQLSASTLDILRRAPTGDLIRLSGQRPPFCSVVIDEPMLRLAIKRLEQIGRRQEQIHWFMRRGAPAAMMLELFGLNELAFRRLRASVNPGTRRGRTARLDARTEQEVLRQWQRTRDLGGDMAARCRILAEAFPELPIAALWATTRGVGP